MTKISTHLHPIPIDVPAAARDMLDLRSIGITDPLFAVTYTPDSLCREGVAA